MKSWKTSLTGIAAILTAVGAAIMALMDNDPATVIDVAATAAAIMAGVGLIFARDNNVSSEAAGAK
jgi:hypothetical protein|tara:strand:- start:583 stop:780 length:198 start_codon:yes stop_codon:yes gene_type:complete